MKILKYKLPSGRHILLYGTDDKLPDELFQYIGECTKEDIELPIFKQGTFLNTINKERTSDKILIENGIESIQDLTDCYYHIRNKVSNLSKRVRDLVIEKYSEIINNCNF